MKYGNFAKHYQFEHGVQGIPTPGDAQWLTGGEKHVFTPGQFAKFTTRLDELRSKQKQKLINQGVIDG